MYNLEPKKLSSRHRAIMRRLIAGHSLKEIAEEFGYTPSRLSIIVNSTLFKKEKERMEKEIEKQFVENEGSKVQTDLVRARLAEEALPSLETIVSLRDTAQSEKVRQASAFDILNRAGYKEPIKVEASGQVEVGDGLANAIKEAVAAIRAQKEDKGDGVHSEK